MKERVICFLSGECTATPWKTHDEAWDPVQTPFLSSSIFSFCFWTPTYILIPPYSTLYMRMRNIKVRLKKQINCSIHLGPHKKLLISLFGQAIKERYKKERFLIIHIVLKNFILTFWTFLCSIFFLITVRAKAESIHRLTESAIKLSRLIPITASIKCQPFTHSPDWLTKRCNPLSSQSLTPSHFGGHPHSIFAEDCPDP